jgi:hypothetical protein
MNVVHHKADVVKAAQVFVPWVIDISTVKQFDKLAVAHMYVYNPRLPVSGLSISKTLSNPRTLV